MGRLEQRKRNRNKRQIKSIVAIGCEGKNKTETIYFKNFSSRECIIKFSTGRHTDPVGMAKDLVNFIQSYDIKVEYGDKIYPFIKDKTDVAINNAKSIEKYHIENGQVIDSENANPHTSAYKVVEELNNRNKAKYQ